MSEVTDPGVHPDHPVTPDLLTITGSHATWQARFEAQLSTIVVAISALEGRLRGLENSVGKLTGALEEQRSRGAATDRICNAVIALLNKIASDRVSLVVACSTLVILAALLAGGAAASGNAIDAVRAWAPRVTFGGSVEAPQGGAEEAEAVDPAPAPAPAPAPLPAPAQGPVDPLGHP